MSAPTDAPATVRRWHEIVATKDPAAVDDFLAEDAVFRSPAVHTPQVGRATAAAYLRAALVVLGPGLRYEREWYGEDSAVLEFVTVVGGKDVHGVDMLRWGADGRVVEFTVMVRPLRGLQVLVEEMGAELTRAAGA